MTHSIIVNGEEQPLTAGSVWDLLQAKSIDPLRRGVAVAVNGAVLSRRAWRETALESGDEIEIVKPFAGG